MLVIVSWNARAAVVELHAGWVQGMKCSLSAGTSAQRGTCGFRARRYFLKSRSNALRASSAFRGAGGPLCDEWLECEGVEFELDVGEGAGVLAVPSRATVTRGVNEVHSFALSFDGIRTGIGLRHW